MNQRTIQEVKAAQASRDGDGVAIQRVAGMHRAGMDPILVIDELRPQRREDSGGGGKWISAGRGIIHSGMPTLDGEGFNGFQLWINLPAATITCNGSNAREYCRSDGLIHDLDG